MRIIVQLTCFASLSAAIGAIEAVRWERPNLEAQWRPAGSDGQLIDSSETSLFNQAVSNATISFDDDIQLVARQSCRIGTPCGAGCCSPGRVCVGGGCCPLGSQKCGSIGCYNPGTDVCCGANSMYCKRGFTCVQDGCCPNGESKCGTQGCYNPRTEICCGGRGTYCPNTFDCVSGGCCPKGQLRCGAKGCYDPKTSVCCGTSSRSCLKNEDCLDNGTKCCPKGQKQCGNRCYDPNIAKCCSSGGTSWACPKAGACCNDAKSCYFPDWEKCCADGACPAETNCCGKECCARGSTCGNDQHCTYTATTTRKTVTSTRTCTTPTLATPQTATRTIPFVYDPNRRAKIWRTSKTIPHTNQAIMWNMCRGINKYNGGLGGNKLTLTHGGECFKKFNRKKMCTEDDKAWCRAAINEFIAEAYGGSPPAQALEAIKAAGNMQCDEFPFATSVEGGDLVNGLRICVPADDQSFQGTSMGKFFGKNKKNPILEGEKYTIEIKGWDCDKQAPDSSIKKRNMILEKRLAFDNDGIHFGEESMFRGFDPESPNVKLMAMPLGDLNAGEYSVNLNITNGALNLSLIDFNGMEFEFTTSSDGRLHFSLDDERAGISLEGLTFDEDVEVVYHATAVLTRAPESTETVTQGASGTTSTPSATSTPSKASAVLHLGKPFWKALLFIAVIFMYF